MQQWPSRFIATGQHSSALLVSSFLALHVATAFYGSDIFVMFLPLYGLAYLLYICRDRYGWIATRFTYPFYALLLVLNFDRIISGGLTTLDATDKRLLLFPIAALLLIAAADRLSRKACMSPRLVIDGVAVGLLIGCVVLLVEGGGEIHLGHLLGTRRSSGLLGWYNHNIADDIYMALAILSAVVGSSMLSRQRSAVTIGAAILFTVIFVYAVAFIVQGQSRGAWVAIAFASLVVWCVFRRSAAKTLGLYALVALVIILLKYGVIFDRAGGAAIIAPAAAQSVLAQGTATSIAPERNVVELHSIDARLRLWQAGIELIQKQPIRGYFGWDWEQIRKDTSFRKLLQTFPHLHNLWIEAAVRFGLFYSLGLGIAMMVVLFFLLRCGLELREADPHAAALGAGTAFYFLFFLSENAFDLNLPQKEVMNITLMFAALAGFATSQAAWPASRNSAQPVVRSS